MHVLQLAAVVALAGCVAGGGQGRLLFAGSPLGLRPALRSEGIACPRTAPRAQGRARAPVGPSMAKGGRGRVGAAPKKSGKSSSTSSKRWLNEHVNDQWVKQAQKDGFRSRAAYKLLQLQEADQILKPGQAVLDLGSAPGSWSQVARKLVGSTGTIIATDILEMKALPGVIFIQGDFLEDFSRKEVELALGGKRADVMLSDLAPNLSGNSILDQGRAYNLVDIALYMADTWLKKGGSTAIKVFQGEGYDECLASMRAKFATVKIRKPKASRDRSTEIYLVGLGFHGPGAGEGDVVEEEPVGGGGGGGEEGGGGGNAGAVKKNKKLDDLMEGMYDD